MSTKRKPYGKRKVQPKKGKPTVKKLDARIKKIEHEEETKWFETRVSSSVVYAAPVIQALSLITQGDTQNSRQGNMINATSIQIKMSLVNNATNYNTTSCRMMLLWDKCADGALPTAYGSNDSVLDATAAVDPTLMNRNRNMLDRFHIIWDKVYTWNPQVHDGTYNQQLARYIGKYRKLGRLIKYKANAGTIGDAACNSLIFMFMTTLTAFGPIVEANFRLNYKDD